MEALLGHGKNISLSDLIALLALILAALSFGWNVLNAIQDYPRANIRVMIASLLQPGTGIKDDNTYFSVTITNIGRRPIKINGIAYVGYKWWWIPRQFKRFILLPKQLPIILKESEEHVELYPYKPEDFKKFLDTNIQSIFIYDSIGRYHRLPRRDISKFRKEIEAHLERELLKQTG